MQYQNIFHACEFASRRSPALLVSCSWQPVERGQVQDLQHNNRRPQTCCAALMICRGPGCALQAAADGSPPGATQLIISCRQQLMGRPMLSHVMQAAADGLLPGVAPLIHSMQAAAEGMPPGAIQLMHLCRQQLMDASWSNTANSLIFISCRQQLMERSPGATPLIHFMQAAAEGTPPEAAQLMHLCRQQLMTPPGATQLFHSCRQQLMGRPLKQHS